MAVLAVKVTWTYTPDPAKPEDGFIVYRQESATGSWTQAYPELARVGTGVLSYTDATVQDGYYYIYKVAAYAGVSTWGVSSQTPSGTVQAKIPAPNAPGIVTAQVVMV